MVNFGVAITTHNRRSTFTNTLQHWLKHLPDGAPLVVVDDGSSDPVLDTPGVKVVRHPYAKGIAMAKNRCITELMDAGCEHLFLADDDVYPIAGDWWRPYVESPEHHLQFGWPHQDVRRRDNSGWPPRITVRDDQHTAYTFPRGVLQYATRQAIEAAGGMDTAYGAHGGEHVDWSRRIHAAGLTTWPYADVAGSEKLFYSADQHEGNTTGSSRFEWAERRRMCEANGARWGYQFAGYPFFPYVEGASVQDWSLGPRLTETFEGTLDHVLGLHPFGVAVEFGVGEGHSLRRIAARMPAWGFDSWEGLPERWRDGFDAGMFACAPPTLENTTLVQGWFADTLPRFDFAKLGPVGLWHLDADLYSSTATILNHIEAHLAPGAYIVFDEYHGYPGADGEHEQLAFREWAQRSGWGWTVVGHGPEQLALRIV